MKRGEIYFITENYRETGSEQYAGRPAIIVSDDALNTTSPVLSVIYLTTSPKRNLPTHFKTYATGKASVAICEQISTVDKTRLEKYCGTLTEDEICDLDRCLCKALGILFEDGASDDGDYNSEDYVSKAAYIELKLQKEMYEKMYNDIIGKVLQK